jgi:hypothetical protein
VDLPHPTPARGIRPQPPVHVADLRPFESISSTFAKTGLQRLGDVIRNARSLIYTRESEDYLGWGEFRAEGLRDGAARWRRM